MMEFSAAIRSKMLDVNTGSTEPFILYRDNDGGWHCDYTKNQYGETFSWVEDAKAQDPLAIIYTGKDFSKASVSTVYDTMLYDRMRAEYYLDRNSGRDSDRLDALACFIQENIGELSQKVTEYLTTLERPLAALDEMLPFSLSANSDAMYYNEDLTEDAISCIENAVHNRLHIESDKATPEKRIFEGYEEIAAVQVNRRLIFVGENKTAENPYMVAEFRWDNPFGALESKWAGTTEDYLEAMHEFGSLVQNNVRVVESDRSLRKNLYDVEPLTLTADHCIPGGLDEDLTGKLIVIKPEVLSPEFRRADHQLRVCNGGFGASPTARGNAVFCAELFNGKESRFERHDVLGVADVTKMPQWVTARLKAYEASKAQDGIAADATNKPKTQTKSKPNKKPSLLGKLDEAKAEAAAHNAGRNAAPNTKKRGQKEV